MFTIRIKATLLLDIVALSLLSTHLVFPPPSPCNSNSRRQFHHALLANSYGNLSTTKSMQSHWLVTIETLPSRTQAYKLRLHPLSPMRLEAFQSDTTFIAPMPMPRLLWDPRLYHLTGYARFSMPAPTPTSFSTTSVLSFMIRIIATSELSHPMSLSDAWGSSTKSHIASHTLLTSMQWTPWPACTSAWLLAQVHLHLLYLCDTNSEIFLLNKFAAPAATIQAFVNGAIRFCLPSKEHWIQV